MVATQILAKVNGQQLQRAVEELGSGAYTITVIEQSEQEIRGFVANGDGEQYGVVLSERQSLCSCPDSMYRKIICKHIVTITLHVIRHPVQAQPQREWSSNELARDGVPRRLPALPYEELPC